MYVPRLKYQATIYIIILKLFGYALDILFYTRPNKNPAKYRGVSVKRKLEVV